MSCPYCRDGGNLTSTILVTYCSTCQTLEDSSRLNHLGSSHNTLSYYDCAACLGTKDVLEVARRRLGGLWTPKH